MAQRRSIYHITHVDNLPAIIQAGGLWSDRRISSQPGASVVIGFDNIKRRRMNELPVRCHSGTMVGDYVPFYFCPRSPMLFVIHKRNRDLKYQGGQDRVVHLVSTVDNAIVAAADRPWAFSDGNAGARYTQFSADLGQLDTFVDWSAVNATDWRDPIVKERKQAEFLVHDWFPWTGFVGIGVIGRSLAADVKTILARASHQPPVAVKPSWYY